MQKTRLTIEKRLLLDALLKENYRLKDIAKALNVEPSTISREIKKRRTSNSGTIICEKTNRYPFICYNCEKKTGCKKKKFYYSYKAAQKDYEDTLKLSRIGIDMDPDEVEYWNDYFLDKIKNKNQPILHMFKEIEDSFPRSIQTFYKYVHKGYFTSINDEMLPRSFSYKPRKKKKENPMTIPANSEIKARRLFSDYKNYMLEHPNANVVQMDTVIGKFEDKNCILTLYFTNEKLMLMFLIKKYNPSEVVKVFKQLQKELGEEKFKEMFEVILTDNGWEFSRPKDIESSIFTKEKIINLFYTDSYSSWQKGGIERNHEFIRYIIPKGITFDKLTKKNIVDMINHINNVQRKSLNYQTPFAVFNLKYGEEISSKLHL
ncbi:MAG: IS30 family transposase [Bacteroidales bacterium]|nr:IS30 family transposase [Bacteroidales bacterium]